jgi:hypothetical protein
LTAGSGAAPLRLCASLVCTRDGTLHGLGGWFEARLSPGAVMTTSPLAPDAIARRNAFFPVERPLAVTAGDTVDVRMAVLPAEPIASWSVDVRAASGALRAAFRHSTLEGMLIAREDLARTRPDFQPRLTERGRARQSVLEWCDGGRTVAQIETDLRTRYPALFRDQRAAAAFVAEVVTRYTE